jgi:hypothetical protein
MKPSLFPTDLPTSDWGRFEAQGFAQPVCGVAYRLGDTVANGMSLGGIDTGCIELETAGLLGCCTIFMRACMTRVSCPALKGA